MRLLYMRLKGDRSSLTLHITQFQQKCAGNLHINICTVIKNYLNIRKKNILMYHIYEFIPIRSPLFPTHHHHHHHSLVLKNDIFLIG